MRHYITNMRSIYDGIKTVNSFLTVISGSLVGTITGTSVDTKGLNSAMLSVDAGPITAAGTLQVTLQEAPDNVTWTTANDNTGTAIGFTIGLNSTAGSLATHAQARIEGLNVNRKRYLRVLGSLTNTLGVSTVVATIIAGRAFEEPVFAGSSTVSNT